MDEQRFDRITRSLGSRRGVFAALLGGAIALAHGDADAKRERKKSCRHFRVKVVCRDRCGTLHNPNSCSRRKRCTCKRGKTCLPNKICGLSCASAACPAEAGCACSSSEPKVCLAPFTSCEDVSTACETTAECPAHFSCDEAPCGEGGVAEKRCVPLCGHSAMFSQEGEKPWT
jgi:hypothetical protein